MFQIILKYVIMVNYDFILLSGKIHYKKTNQFYFVTREIYTQSLFYLNSTKNM